MNATSQNQASGGTLPVVPVSEIDAYEAPRRWLIEGLWGAAAVGFCCGNPKSGKSWLGLEIAVSVATGTPALGRFPVKERGGVLVYLAEDSLEALRERVAGIAAYRGLTLGEVDIHVITTPSLRLDTPRDRSRLLETVAKYRPRLLLLDPLVRLHDLNENDSREISGLLSYLRDIQRKHDVAILLVHHARKNGSAHGGQGLRGSGDFWAWSDTNLYLRRVRGNLLLSMEHRSAPSPDPVYLELMADDPETVHLEVTEPLDDEKEHDERSLGQRVIEELAGKSAMTRQALREELAVKNERLGQALDLLESEGLIERTSKGWRLHQS